MFSLALTRRTVAPCLQNTLYCAHFVLSCRETQQGFMWHYQLISHKISLPWMSTNLSTEHTWRQTLLIGKQFAEPSGELKHFWTLNSNNFSAGQYSDCFWDTLNYPEEPGDLSAKFLTTFTDLIWPLTLSRLFWKPQLRFQEPACPRWSHGLNTVIKHDLLLLEANDGVPAGVQGMRWLYHPSQQCIFCAMEQDQEQWSLRYKPYISSNKSWV